MAHSTRVLSLFSGIGGLDLGVHEGLRRVGRNALTVGYVEREIFAVANLAHQVEAGALDTAPIWIGDIRRLDAENLGGMVDLVCGGFPCQDISCAGKGAGLAGARSGLWFTMLDIACDVGARYIFVENVGALRRRGLAAVLGSLHESGFDAEWLSLRASEVGAPHRRERVFILAHRRGERPQRLVSSGTTQGAVGRSGRAEPADAARERLDGTGNPRQGSGRLPGASAQDVGHSTDEGLPQPRQAGERELCAEGREGLHDRPELGGGELADRDRRRQPRLTQRDGEQRQGLDGQPGDDVVRRGDVVADTKRGEHRGDVREAGRKAVGRVAAQWAGESVDVAHTQGEACGRLPEQGRHIGAVRAPDGRGEMRRGASETDAVEHADGIQLNGQDAPVREGKGGGVGAAGAGPGARPPLWPPRPDDAEGWQYVIERWPWLAPAINQGRVVDNSSQRRHREPDDAIRAGRDGVVGASEPRYGEALPEFRRMAHGVPDWLDGDITACPDNDRPEDWMRNDCHRWHIPGFCVDEDGVNAYITERMIYRAGGNRVDRLRGLGNSVVPEQAAVAFEILWWRLHT